MQQTLLRCFLAAVTAVSVILGFSISRVRADTALPDPPQCGTEDAEDIYISIFHDVFRLPYAMISQIKIIPLEAGGDLLPYPPNPLAPPGCFANPIRAKFVRMNVRLREILPATALPDAPMPVVGLAILPPTVSWQQLHEDNFDRLCATKDHPVIIETTPEGLKRCAVKTGQRPPYDLEASYRASPDLYATPFGEPFIIRTGHEPLLYGGDSQIDYKIDDEVSLYYQFWLKDLPIQNVLDFDRALRAKIEDARVKNYVWP